MMHRRIDRLGILACLWVAVGCGGGGRAEPPSGDEPDADVEESNVVCAPRALSREAAPPQELMAWLAEAEASGCRLSDMTGSANPGFPTQPPFIAPGTETCDADGTCWVELPAFVKVWDRAGQGEVHAPEHFIGIVRARRADDGGLLVELTSMRYGSSAVEQFEWRYDSRGHIRTAQHRYGGASWFAVENEWDGDHLVSSVFVDSINGTGTTTFVWNYEGDRMIDAVATHEPTGRVSRTVWNYDSEGRPSGVMRTIDGQQWLQQSWTYGNGVRIESADTTVDVELADRVHGLTDLDDLAPELWPGIHTAWEAARPTDDGSCVQLPHSVTYGYPASEVAYDLGWPMGQRPSGMDGDYGYGGVFDSALDRWYGHDRVGTYTPPWRMTDMVSTPFHVHSELDANGQLVSETVTSDGGGLGWERTRQFEGGRVQVDSRAAHAGAKQIASTLSFSYDAEGRIESREHSLDDILVARHSWARTDGEITRHEIAHHPLSEFALPELFPDLSNVPAELPPPIVHERIPQQGGILTLQRDGVMLEERTHDTSGRITRIRTVSSHDDYTYATDGTVLSFVSDWASDGEPDMSLGYEVEDDRITSRSWLYPSSSGTETFTYACD